MDFADEDSIPSFDDLQKVIEEADNIVLDLSQNKSKAKYMAVYDKCVQWLCGKGVAQKDIRERVMLL